MGEGKGSGLSIINELFLQQNSGTQSDCFIANEVHSFVLEILHG